MAEFFKSLLLLIWGVLKRWYLLAIAVLSDPWGLAEELGMPVSIPYPINIALFWFFLGLAIVLTYHDLRKSNIELKEKSEKATKLYPKKRLSLSHRMTLIDIERQMEIIHGHSDHNGLETDMLDGILAGDLMKHNCHRCDKPRNQKGDDLVE